MKIQITLILFLFFGSINCLSKNYDLKENETFKEFFTKKEIKDLQLLFDFFNESICRDSLNKNLTNCYSSLYQEIEKGQLTGTIRPEISFEEQNKVYGEIRNKTFKEIWAFGEQRHFDSQDVFRSVQIYWKGKYIKYLEELGNENETLYKYFKLVQETGTVPQMWHLKSFLRDKEFDLSDVRIQFIVAIHLLTENDSINRREKVKKKQWLTINKGHRLSA